MGRGWRLTLFWRYFCIYSYPLAKNVTSSSLRIISSLKLVKHFQSGFQRSEDTPKTAFLVILEDIWNLMVGQGHSLDTQIRMKIVFRPPDLPFSEKTCKKSKRISGKTSYFDYRPFFLYQWPQNCIGNSRCLGHQVNNVQITPLNFFPCLFHELTRSKNGSAEIEDIGANRSPYY